MSEKQIQTPRVAALVLKVIQTVSDKRIIPDADLDAIIAGDKDRRHTTAVASFEWMLDHPIHPPTEKPTKEDTDNATLFFLHKFIADAVSEQEQIYWPGYLGNVAGSFMYLVNEEFRSAGFLHKTDLALLEKMTNRLLAVRTLLEAYFMLQPEDLRPQSMGLELLRAANHA